MLENVQTTRNHITVTFHEDMAELLGIEDYEGSMQDLVCLLEAMQTVAEAVKNADSSPAKLHKLPSS